MSGSFNRYERYQVGLDCSCDVVLTEQSHKKDCDMHRIVGQLRETGVTAHVKQYAGTYQNFIGVPDFQQAMDAIADAKTMFETVPSHIRNQFNNDPGQFLGFMQDNANYEAIQEMGLDVSHLTKPPEAAAEPVSPSRS